MSAKPVTFDPTASRFDWDEAAFATELDAEGRARHDAAHGEPREGAADCSFLAAVGSATATIARAARHEVSSSYGVVIDHAAPPAHADAELRKEQDAALGDMEQICRNGIDATTPLKEAVNTTRAQYTDFTVNHGLVGETADDQDRWATCWISGVAALELGLNAWTLGTAHPSGLVGVLPEMFVFTAVNVFAGLVIAYGRRRKNHHPKFRARRLTGWLCVAAAVVLVPLANLVFGHYRDALVSLQREIADGDYQTFLESWAVLFRTALATAFSDEWIPKSMQTVALIFGGMFMAGLVQYKRYRADDPYPGFGELSRKRQRAQELYVREVAAINRRVTGRADDAIAALSAIATEVALAPALATEMRFKFESWGDAYRNLVAGLTDAAKKRLEAYRRTNRGLKPWPETLDAAFDGFALDPALSDPPEPPTVPDGQDPDILSLREQCDKVVLLARSRYGSEVFAPLLAVDPNDQNHRQFADPVGKLREIKREISGMLRPQD